MQRQDLFNCYKEYLSWIAIGSRFKPLLGAQFHNETTFDF